MDIEKFYGTEKWKRKRAAILARDKYQCQICKRYGRMRQATEVHHIVHLEDDPSRALDGSNLISFVIGENSLKSALVSVPDLRASHLSLGLSVDLSWSNGLNFENVVLGQ